jgi:hypothetical protein
LYGDVNGFHFFGKGPEVRIEADEPAEAGDGVAGFDNPIRGRTVTVVVPGVERNPQTGLVTPDFHVLLQVTNPAGPYPIRRYKRVIFSYVLDGVSVSLGKIPEGFD